MTQGIPGGSINGAPTTQLGGTITNVLSPFTAPEAWDSITIGGMVWGSPGAPSPNQLPGLPPPFGGSGGFQTTGLDGIVTTAVQGQPGTPNGYVVIDGAERRFSWDPKHGKSQEGWVPTYQGTKGKQFKLRFRMWTDAQFQYWLTYRDMFDYLLLKIGSGATPVAPGKPTLNASSGSGGTVSALSISNPKLAMLGIHAIYVENIHELKPIGDKLEFESVVDVWEFRPPPPRNASATANGAKTRPAIGFHVSRTPSEIAVEKDVIARDALAAQAAGWTPQ